MYPTYLQGYVGHVRDLPATGVHDIPELNSILLEIEDQLILLFAMDVSGFSESISITLKDQICSVYPIKKDNISFAGIHTHSGPNGTSSRSENKSYYHKVLNGVMSSCEELFRSLQDAEPYICSTHIQGFFSNRNSLQEKYDNEAIVLKFVNSKQETIAAILNISCHSTVLGINNSQSSSDLLGAVRQKITMNLGVIPVTFMGAAGDISNRQYRQGDDFLELERCSSGIADQINKNDMFEKIEFNHISRKDIEYQIKYNNEPNFPVFELMVKDLEISLANEKLSDVDRKLKATSLKQFKAKLQEPKVDYTVRVKVYDFGGLRIVTFGGELSSKFGMELKKSVGSKVMIITCVDDHTGYFIEEEKYGLYYETIATKTPKGVPEIIVSRIKEALN